MTIYAYAIRATGFKLIDSLDGDCVMDLVEEIKALKERVAALEAETEPPRYEVKVNVENVTTREQMADEVRKRLDRYDARRF
jgi:hypothetical protein